MKVKTSVTLSRELLADIDEVLGSRTNRSKLIETALKDFLANLRRRQRDAADRSKLDRHAEPLSVEMEDILQYQDAGG